MVYYPRLVEACIEFKIHSRKISAVHEKQQFFVTQDMESCPIVNGYTVVRDETNGQYYCLKEG